MELLVGALVYGRRLVDGDCRRRVVALVEAWGVVMVVGMTPTRMDAFLMGRGGRAQRRCRIGLDDADRRSAGGVSGLDGARWDEGVSGREEINSCFV